MEGQNLIVYYKKYRTLNQKIIEIPQDPCPASFILEKITSQEDLTKMATKPQLFYAGNGAKLGDNELVPKNSRLEYNIVMPAVTTIPASSERH